MESIQILDNQPIQQFQTQQLLSTKPSQQLDPSSQQHSTLQPIQRLELPAPQTPSQHHLTLQSNQPLDLPVPETSSQQHSISEPEGYEEKAPISRTTRGVIPKDVQDSK